MLVNVEIKRMDCTSYCTLTVYGSGAYKNIAGVTQTLLILNSLITVIFPLPLPHWLMIKTNQVHLFFIFAGRHASQLFEGFGKIREVIKSRLNANF